MIHAGSTPFVPDWDRRRFLKALGVVGTSVLWNARGRKVCAAGREIRVGVRRECLAALSLRPGIAAGYFAREGISCVLEPYETSAVLGAALARREVDAAVLPTPLFFALHLGTGPFDSAGTPLVTWQVASTDGSALAVPASSPIAFSLQFRGKKIGVVSDFDMPRLLTGIYLRLGGLVPGRDTVWVRETPSKLPRLLESGAVDALAVEGTVFSEALRDGTARVLLPLQRVWAEHPAELWAVTETLWNEAPDTVRYLATATMRGARDLTRRGESSAPPIGGAPDLGLRSGFQPFPYVSSLKIVLGELRKRGLTPTDVNLQAVAERVCLHDVARETMASVGFPEIPGEDTRKEKLVGCCNTFD